MSLPRTYSNQPLRVKAHIQQRGLGREAKRRKYGYMADLERERQSALYKFLDAKTKEHGMCFGTARVNSPFGEPGEQLCFMEDHLLLLSLKSSRGDSFMTTAQLTVHWSDITTVAWTETDPLSFHLSTTDGGAMLFNMPRVDPDFRLAFHSVAERIDGGPPARLWALEIRLRTGLPWADTDGWYIRNPKPFYDSPINRARIVQTTTEEMFNSVYGPIRIFDAAEDQVVEAKNRRRMFRPWSYELTFVYCAYDCEIELRDRAILILPAETSPRTPKVVPLAAITSTRAIEDTCLLISTPFLSLTFNFYDFDRRELWHSALDPTPRPSRKNTGSSTSETTLTTTFDSVKPPPNIGARIKTTAHPVANGGFASVYEGWYERETGLKEHVAVKVIQKRDEVDEAKLNKRLRREIKVWGSLQHRNVIELTGITFEHGPFMSMVCPWMDGGTLSAYIQRLGATLSISSKLSILCDVASGLSYLHSQGIIHGDLTTVNILLDAHSKAVLADFGLSIIMSEFPGTSYMTTTLECGGALRWAAPELIPNGDSPHKFRMSTTTDVYSSGGVIDHVFSGRMPFHDLRDWDIIHTVGIRREHPPRPTGEFAIEDKYWDFIESCWNIDPTRRPTAADILAFLRVCRMEFVSVKSA
ncbi:kinase-like domain-containing protein [Mycena galericulata]|nr:kinase-like domain-containing protein [Mycena galericulata]